MNDNTQLVGELRNLFRNGTTPSGLIEHIRAELGSAISYSELCEILEIAFNLPAVRLSPSSIASGKKHKGVVLNKTLLMEIVDRRSEWDISTSLANAVEQSWMHGLSLKTPEQIGNEVRANPFPGLNEKSWTALSSEEQNALYAQLTSGLVMSQRLDVLARLLERLQQKVLELEEYQNSSKVNV